MELAQARLVSNLLPATGPVAGRRRPRPGLRDVPHLPGGQPALLPGLYRAGLGGHRGLRLHSSARRRQGKIKDDLTSICTQGTPVHTVYFLCTEPVKVSTRHDLKDWATQKFGVTLEVSTAGDRSGCSPTTTHSGSPGRTFTCPRDLPRSPPPGEPAGAAWYARLRDDWAQGDRAIGNFAELMQVAEGLRHATDTAKRPRGPRRLAAADGRGRLSRSRTSRAAAGTLRDNPRDPAREPATYGLQSITPGRSSQTCFPWRLPATCTTRAVLLQYLDTAARIRRVLDQHRGSEAHGRQPSAPTSPHCWRTRPRPAAVRGCSGRPLTWRCNIDFDAPGSLRRLRNRPTGPHLHTAPDDLLDIEEFPAWIPLTDIDLAMASLLELIDFSPRRRCSPSTRSPGTSTCSRRRWSIIRSTRQCGRDWTTPPAARPARRRLPTAAARGRGRCTEAARGWRRCANCTRPR